MRKLLACRRYLMERLEIPADTLLSFAQDGTVTSHRAPDSVPGARARRFALRYEARFIVTDYARPTENLLFVMLEWLHRDNPGVKPDALRFHADILDHRVADVSLAVELTETIDAEPADGGVMLRPATDPDAHAFDMEIFHPPEPEPEPEPEPAPQRAPRARKTPDGDGAATRRAATRRAATKRAAR